MFVSQNMEFKIIISILLFFASSSAFSQNQLPTDTIMKRTMDAAEKYDGLVENYEAEVYMRTYVETIKKNFLYKYTSLIPNFVLFDPKSDEAVIETMSNLRYTQPNSYVQDIKYVTGSITDKKSVEMIPFNLLNINVYGETTFDESFVMPLRSKSSRYYRYHLVHKYNDENKTYYTIAFNPIYESPKLLRGSCIIEHGTWRVVQFLAEGIDVAADFSFEITMGNDWITNYLPTDFKIYRTTSYLGNKIASRYVAKINYKDILLKDLIEDEKTLNISDFYKVRLDSVPVQNDSVFWENIRLIPLQARETEVIENFKKKQEEESKKVMADTTKNNELIQHLAQRMVIDSQYKYRSTQIRYSGLLNPSMIGYTTQDGLTYRQRLFFQTDLADKKSLQASAFVGYMFKRKEFFSDLSIRWNYEPRFLGNVMLSIGNGNRTYSSLFVNQIQDSLISKGLTFTDISVDYYKDYYLKLFNDIEITNGFLLGIGIQYHIREAVKRSPSDTIVPAPTNGIEDLFRTRYAFVPFVRLVWTPEQYHRFEGRQKIYVRSNYPTFKIELARSFKNIFGSTSAYNRIELDISQNIPFGIMKSLQYHVGGGVFINQQTEYFADFVYFAKNNFPETWNDGIGGTFNLLRRNLYNASDSYLQAHVMYETPFLILKNIPFLSEGVLTERVYASQLYTPQIVSYTELGYGFGNRYFNAAVFSSFHKLTFKEIGVRASLAF